MLLYPMAPDEISETVEETSKVEDNGSINDAPELQSTDTTIPGIENLPEDTQMVITEAYRSREALTKTVESYIQGTEKYKEQIPKVQSIIAQNITPNEEITIEIPAEKKNYIKDTINILKISRAIESLALNLEELKPQEQVRIVQAMRKYASKYQMKDIEEKLDSIHNIKDSEDYYAGNPQAIFSRIKNNLQKTEIPELHFSLHMKLRTIAEDFLNGHTLQTKIKNYEQALYDMHKTFSTHTMTEKNFENEVDNQTRKIDNLHMNLLIEKECYKQIQRTEGIELNYTPESKIKNPSSYIQQIFKEKVHGRLNSATKSLEEKLEEEQSLLREKQLPCTALGAIELNNIHGTLNSLLETYQRNLDTIYETNLQGNSMAHRNVQRTFNTISESEILEQEAKYKELLESEKLLFHGTNILGSRYFIATEGLRSRKKQQELQEKSFYNTPVFSQRSYTYKREEPINIEDDHGGESEALFFAREYNGQYSALGQDQFFIGIPQGIAYRNYSFGYETPSIGGGEEAFLDRDNPEMGVEISKEDSYLFIGTRALNSLKTIYGDKIEDDIKKNWGAHVIISDEKPPSHIHLPNLEPVNHARHVPTGSMWADKGNKMLRVSKMIYEFEKK